jgi:hypothetical protein
MDPDILVNDEDERRDGVEEVVEEIGFLQQVSGHWFPLVEKNELMMGYIVDEDIPIERKSKVGFWTDRVQG